MKKLTLALSPCPNDTLMFDAIVNLKIDNSEFLFQTKFCDIEELNEGLLKKKFDIAKMSVALYSLIMKDYVILKSGMALGFENGPLIVANKKIDLNTNFNGKLLIPGAHTTANFLIEKFFPNIKEKKIVKFNEIMPLLIENHENAGVIIHESRFTYEKYKLVEIENLGKLWHQHTNLPLPLGAIVAKRSLGVEIIKKVERLIEKSVRYGIQNRKEAMGFVRTHAQEIDESVINKHIDLYVNDFSINSKKIGRNAVLNLLNLLPKNHSLSLQNIFTI